MAAKKGKSGGYNKTTQATRKQIVEEFCHACEKAAEVVHVKTLGLKKRWGWHCRDCGTEVERKR